MQRGYEQIGTWSTATRGGGRVETTVFELLCGVQDEYIGEQGWRSGESARLPPMCPGFDSRTWGHMWVEFVVGLVLYSDPRGFSPGSPVFPSPQKPTFPNSNSILECTDISERVLMNSLMLRG